jgi:hypothetical protein
VHGVCVIPDAGHPFTILAALTNSGHFGISVTLP